jgi:hypothetical protein
MKTKTRPRATKKLSRKDMGMAKIARGFMRRYRADLEKLAKL